MQKEKAGVAFSLKRGMVANALFALCLGFSDFYVGIFYAEMSWRIYFAFFIAYLILTIFIGLIVLFLSQKIAPNNRLFYNKLNFILLLFVFDFVVVNVRLSGWFNFLNFRSISDSFLLIMIFVAFAYIVQKIERFNNIFRSLTGTLQIFFLSIIFSSLINIDILNFSTPPSNKAMVLILTMLVGVIPFGAVVLSYAFGKVSSKVFKVSQKDAGGLVFSLIFILVIVPFLIHSILGV